MSEHLTIERISALLDEPWADLAADGHLEGCEACRAEYERLSRMRMAFSALDALDPPADQWSRIDARLDEVLGPRDPIVSIESAGAARRRWAAAGPLQVAAAVALFAGGVLAGLRFTDSASEAGANGQVASAVPTTITNNPEDRAVFDAMSELEALRAPLRQVALGAGPSTGPGSPQLSEVEMLRMSARLDGLIRATREGLERSPGDPFASAYLLELIDTRERLAEAIESSLHTERSVRW